MQWVSERLSSLANEFPATPALQRSGNLTRAQLQRFFKEQAALLDRPEVKVKLRDTHAQGKDVDEEVTRLQELLFEKQGVNGSHGVSCLGKVHDTYSNDPELIQDFMQFVNREESAIEEAELSQQEYENRQKVRQRAAERTQQLQQQMLKLPPEDREAFVQQQEEACQQLQASLTETPQKGRSMSDQEQQRFFEMLRKVSPREP